MKGKEKLERAVLASGWFGIDNPFGSSEFNTIEGTADKVGNALDTIVNFGALVAILVIVVGAYQMITAGGDPEKISQGQKTATYAVIGLVVAFIAKLVILFIAEELGL